MSDVSGPWTCPKCQVKNDPDFTHCHKCGERNPEVSLEEVTCTSCGTKHSRETCCPLCGSKEFLQL
jgi:hypothetical protein